MADERVVAVKLEQIEQYHREPKEKQATLSRQDLRTQTTEQRAVERLFENVIQACADLAQLVATHDLGFDGSTSKGAIPVLGRNGVIEERTMQTLVAAVGFRNVLAHEYGKIDYGEVYELLQNDLSVYDAYSQQIAQWVQTDEQRSESENS